ncbi:3-keto-L-gulonate-6-phosphate decarboxylase UlaD [Staphylococcus simulans]|uniref:3-keto-L-gulonate-6-phosphate decarboxylase UlaD n=1 Tax=Staphylococcus simulans TaxID=1286 RepID=UPI000D02E063|nr:3-keto-L-gulonate-6-phosphate decarboxylase UlaD [Staphylococcus simulans]UXR34385.1 3-keto-L-gulonate-6-phosphate decarboxylase UlaD [Staphylococcus simulans]
MALPKLQIALDNNSIISSIKTLKQVGDVVDILEVGTILCLAEGSASIATVRALFPDKIILADTKCADAGKTVAENCRKAGANWMTVICCATIETMIAARDQVEDLQVELYGDWTFEQAKSWKENNINQVVYHQSRDALLSGKTWSEEDLNKIGKLIDMGFKVSVTGGLEIETVKLFKDLKVHAFIAGRGIRDAQDPKQAAIEFKQEIEKVFS